MNDTIYALVGGKWSNVMRGGQKPDVYVTYATDSRPNDSWRWWAAGRVGEAETLEDAKRAAEAVVERREP